MINFLKNKIINFINPIDWEDKTLILSAKSIVNSNEWLNSTFKNLHEKEFRVYSQFGDDGIIQFLINKLPIINNTFIEFGVGDFFESNTHFLLVNNNWTGFVIDGDDKNINKIKKSNIYWKFNITAQAHFINKDNINKILEDLNSGQVGLMHIDLDGNDYWILKSIALENYSPDILILEYNPFFGFKRSISVPYDPNFSRFKYHFSGLYYGCSLMAHVNYCKELGYFFVGSNSAGNNAYFIKNKYKNLISEYKNDFDNLKCTFRDGRNISGALSYSPFKLSVSSLAGMNVINTMNMEKEII